jgi:predicted enzyme related to lactoylglutathione lyase
MANPVAWFEVTGPDGAVLQGFYSDLFDWKIDASNPMSYGMVEAAEGGIGGGVAGGPDSPAQVAFYVAVPDLQVALDKATQLGGKVITPPMDVPGGPAIAFFSDPAGNRIGLMKS